MGLQSGVFRNWQEINILFYVLYEQEKNMPVPLKVYMYGNHNTE